LADQEDSGVRVLRQDWVRILRHHNHVFWAVPQLYAEGVLGLVATSDGPFVVFAARYEPDSWELPLEKVHYLGDPPPAYGIKGFGSAIRVDIDGKRKLIVFTGLVEAQPTKGITTIQMGQLTGHPSPLAMVKLTRWLWNNRGSGRRRREGHSAWVHLLPRVDG
jgi:hypothetical protein